jgi:hypothetical protein
MMKPSAADRGMTPGDIGLGSSFLRPMSSILHIDLTIAASD